MKIHEYKSNLIYKTDHWRLKGKFPKDKKWAILSRAHPWNYSKWPSFKYLKDAKKIIDLAINLPNP